MPARRHAPASLSLAVGWAGRGALALLHHRVHQDSIDGQHGERPTYRQVLQNRYDVQYYGKITIGQQELNAILDTGSTELVVFGDKCTEGCGDVGSLFHSAQSSNFKTGTLQIKQSYGSGKVTGMEGYDDLSVGDMSCEDAPFWEVFKADMPLLHQAEFQAILGVGPIRPGLKFMGVGVHDPNAYAVPLHSLGVKQFGVCLGRSHDSEGYFVWNDDSTSSYPDKFVKLTVPTTKKWMVSLRDVRFGDDVVACAEGCGAVIDSGTSLLALPLEAKSRLAELVDEKGVDCDDVRRLPHLHFKIDGVDFSLPPDAFTGSMFGVSRLLSQNATQGQGVSSCSASVLGVNMHSDLGPTWILGMPFFREFYTVFVQSTEDEPQSIFVSHASEECTPMRDPRKSGPAPAFSREEQGSGRARRIDASRLMLSPWLERDGPAYESKSSTA